MNNDSAEEPPFFSDDIACSFKKIFPRGELLGEKC